MCVIMSEKYLSVYKASAGAGKTYNLVYRYVRLLFEAEETGTAHSRILAVTFTNKSTAEMKERVVRALYEMSEGRHENYINDIMRDVPGRYASAEAVAKRARRLLMQLLFNYSVFNIKTIDAFFQQVIRVFAREMNMYGSFKVELDTDAMLDASVDDILVNLKAPSKMLDWLTEFAEARVDEGHSYKIKDVIVGLASQIFSDEYIKNAARLNEVLAEPDAMKEYRKSLTAIVTEYEGRVKALCDSIMEEMRGPALTAGDFKGGSRSFAAYFDYAYMKGKDFAPSNTFVKAIEERSADAFCQKKSPRAADIEVFVGRCGEKMEELNALLSADCQRDYRTAQVLVKNLYVIGILNDIQNRILERSQETNSFLLTSTSDFIRQIIAGSDTPFIYEKMGVSLDHYMIDEFQDTSKLQWANFLPLIKESVDSGHWNMIVGDVKQSIYRWRDGDWSILQNDVKREFGESVEEIPLATNYRSSRSVIECNNSIFPKMTEAALEDIAAVTYENMDEAAKEARKERFRSIYADVKQKCSRNREGYVEIGFVRGDEPENEAMERTCEAIGDLTQRCGYGYGDITILVRKNAEAAVIAEYLQGKGIPVVSNEAQLVCNALTVRFIVSLMRYIYKPTESLFRAGLAAVYCRLQGMGDESMHEALACSELPVAEWEVRLFGAERAERLSSIKNLTLYRLAEAAVSAFDLYNAVEGEAHYLQAFMDDVYDFSSEETADIYSYLEHYDKKAASFFVPSSGGGNAVSIYTIFKSKGLQFNAVIIPFCNWTLEPVRYFANYRWVETKRPPFDRLPIVPVDMGKGSKKLYATWFADDMRNEYENCFVDTLNVAYVAFTRAVERMYVFPLLTEKDGEPVTESSIPYYLYDTLNSPGGNFSRSEDGTAFYIGNPDEMKVEGRKNAVKTYDFGTDAEVRPGDVEERLRFRADREALWALTGNTRSYVDYGNVMHHILEKITVAGELDAAVESVRREGIFTTDDEAREVREKLARFLADERARDWFSGRYRVMSEAEIMTREGDIYRPDRVMLDEETGGAVVVDYKFGTDINQRHVRQVKRYMSLIEEMGYAPVKGYICYVELGETVEVE